MKKLDKLVKRVEFFERLATYSDRKSFLQRLAQDQSVEPTYTPNPNIAPPTPAVPAPKQYAPFAMPESVSMPKPEGAPAAGQSATRPVSKTLQYMLNQLLVEDGTIPPLKVDGLLGDATRKALQAFQLKYSRPANYKTVSEAFDQMSAAQSQVTANPGAPIEPGKSNFPVGNINRDSNGNAGPGRPVSPKP